MEEVEKTAQDASTEQQGEVKNNVQNASQDNGDAAYQKIAEDAVAKAIQLEKERDNYKQAALNAKKQLKDGGQIVEADEDKINEIVERKLSERDAQRKQDEESESAKLKRRLEETNLILKNKSSVSASTGSNQSRNDAVSQTSISEKEKADIIARNPFAKNWTKKEWEKYDQNVRQI